MINLRKTGWALLLVVIFMFGAVSCATNVPQGKNSTETVSGGTAQENANLKDITLSQSGTGLNIQFSFVSGSQGTTEAEGAIGLPEYTLSFLPNPMRLLLTINDLKFWDYQKNSDLTDSTGLVQGVFKLLPVNSRTSTSLYMNLSTDVTFAVSEADGKLTVHLEKKQPDSGANKYFVAANLFYEYQEGVLPEETGLTPTLCSDGYSVIMLSQPYATSAEAEAQKTAISQNYLASLEGKGLTVIELNTRALPVYNTSLDNQSLREKPLLKRNDKTETAEPFFPEARFLCWRADGQYALFAKTNTDDSALPTEQLYLVSTDGVKTLLFDYDLAQISFASFSPDGNRILFVEQVNEMQILTVYDLQTKKTVVADDAELGSIITGAAFSADGNSVYAMAGDDMLLLKCLDIATGAISSMTFSPGVDTGVYQAGNKLYYMDVIDETEWVVSYDMEADATANLAKADFFLMSGNGRYLLMQKATENSDNMITELSVYDLQTDTTTLIDNKLMITDYFFSLDSEKLYYIADNSANDETYLYSVYRYNIAENSTEKLFDAVNAVFDPANTTGKLFLCARFTSQEVDYPVTYLIDLP